METSNKDQRQNHENIPNGRAFTVLSIVLAWFCHRFVNVWHVFHCFVNGFCTVALWFYLWCWLGLHGIVYGFGDLFHGIFSGAGMGCFSLFCLLGGLGFVSVLSYGVGVSFITLCLYFACCFVVFIVRSTTLASFSWSCRWCWPVFHGLGYGSGFFSCGFVYGFCIVFIALSCYFIALSMVSALFSLFCLVFALPCLLF